MFAGVRVFRERASVFVHSKAMTDVPSSIYAIEVTSIRGETYRLERYRGQVLLIVNVASK